MSGPQAASAARREDGGRSRVTAVARLALAVWMIWSASQTLLDPPLQAALLGLSTALALSLAGLHFTLGMFLVMGFMSRVAGLVLLGLGSWELVAIGRDGMQAAMAVLGLYVMLRGGGAWGMDVYVQAMQDRVREREERERAALSALRGEVTPADTGASRAAAGSTTER
ncbi:MAG: hypothetical protein HYX52_08295 [Chloroflexi bacterium]|nr:hypothetical protein [Chloroflexota bacterium]